MSSEVEKLMSALDISYDEAVELIASDNGEVENEEVEKLTEKAKTVEKGEKRGRKPNSTKMSGVQYQKRSKKENPTKATIIDTLSKALENLEMVSEIDIKNQEKTIFFKVGQETFEIDLKMKRKPKE